MGAVEDRDRALRENGEKVMVSLPVHVRRNPARGSLRRRFYRAEPARDWEPRLDDLWARAKHSYPVAVVRNADFALRRFAGHPTVRHHRFLVLPRLSGKAVAFAVFADDGTGCRWLDLLWDHAHPGALELLAHISGRLVSQWGSGGEHLCLAGDDAASALLLNRGYRIQKELSLEVSSRSFAGDLDLANVIGRAYVTAADIDEVQW